MHVSLDSALGRQRRLNSVGESVLQIAPNAAAAYSLRSLTGADPKVVRVRRASDNGERDFTGSEITSGEMVSWVNRQVIAPLDIQALEADGRTGDFLIAKAAYSLRSLGTRQATIVAFDTDVTTSGKYVVQVRRSSDDALKSFTADEVTDGTLLAFVNEIQTLGTAVNGTGIFDNYTVSNLSTTGFSADNSAGGVGSAGFPYVFKDEDVIVVKYTVTNFSSTSFLSPQIRGVNGTNSVTGVTDSGTAFTANGTYADVLTATADGTHLMFADGNTGSYTISDFEIVSYSSNGFVKTWYDQSVTTQAGDTATANHAVQATAASQPKIVSAGSLVPDNGIDMNNNFLVAPSVSGLTGSLSMFCASVKVANGTPMSLSSSSSNSRYFLISESTSTTAVVPRNTDTGAAASPSVSGNERLTFALTTGATFTAGGANGGAVVTSTADYGDDFSGSNLDQITIGIYRTVSQAGSYNGRIREILVYDSDQTVNRGAIEANIGEAYSITGIPAYDNEVDGFVETWYDQSGNNRPLIQTTASEQPLIVEAGVFQNGVKSNKATSNDTMQNLQVSTDGTNANFGTDDWASGASSKLGAVYVGTVPEDSIVTVGNPAIIWGGGRGVGSFQEGGVSLSVIKGGTDSWRILNERQGLSPLATANSTLLNTDANIVLYGTTDNREFTINVNGSGDTATVSADLDVRSTIPLSLFGSYASNADRYYQRSSGGVCKECYLYAGDPVANIPALATSINAHYSIY